MNYLDELGRVIQLEVEPQEVPSGDTAGLFRLYALLALAKGSAVTAEDVHNAWSAWMSGQDPSHESIRPFHELDPTVQREDDPYVAAIQKVARQIRS